GAPSCARSARPRGTGWWRSPRSARSSWGASATGRSCCEGAGAPGRGARRVRARRAGGGRGGVVRHAARLRPARLRPLRAVDRDRSRLPAPVYPPLVIVGVSLFSEPLFIAFVLGAVAAALRTRAGPVHALRWAVLSGVFAGLAWLTRSNGFTVLPALCLLVWTARPRLSRA